MFCGHKIFFVYYTLINEIENDWETYTNNLKLYMHELKKYNAGNVNVDFKSYNVTEEHGKTVFITLEVIDK